MENKKFKLNKENLDVVSLMQHIVFINISSFDMMKVKDFSDKEVQKQFELLCESYIRLHESFSIYKRECLYNEMLSPLTNKYIIQPDKRLVAYHLIIDLEKEYNNCAKIGIQTSDRMIEPVPINIFNIKFEAGY